MKISKLILHNFRNHKHREFDFTDGLNVITGKNGTGKSSIFNAINFALFGITSLEYSKDEIKNWDAEQGENFYVDLHTDLFRVFRSDERVELYIDNKLVLESTTEVNNKISQILNLDKDLFKIVGHVGQKELSFFSTLKASERQKFIKMLAKIDKIEDAVLVLQNEKRTLKKQVDFLKSQLENFPKAPIDERRYSYLSDKVGVIQEAIVTSDKMIKIKAQNEKNDEQRKFYQEQMDKHSEFDERLISYSYKSVLLDKDIKIQNSMINKQLSNIEPYSEIPKDVSQYDHGYVHTYRMIKDTYKGLPEVVMTEEEIEKAKNYRPVTFSCNFCGADFATTCPECGEDFLSLNDLYEKYQKYLSYKEDKEKKVFLETNEEVTREEIEAWEDYQSVLEQIETFKSQLVGRVFPTMDNHDDILQSLDNYKRYCEYKEKFDEVPDNKPIGEIPDVHSLVKELDVVRDEINQIEKQKGLNRQHERISLELSEVSGNFALYNETWKLMKKFNAEESSRLLPSVEKEAGNFFVNCVEGKYKSLSLNNKFDIIIDKKRVGLYSGGEIDLANLSLRLGISKYLKSVNNSVIDFVLLDEITSAFDDDRIDNVLTGINNLKELIPQIILITHQSLTKSYGDNFICLNS